MYKPSDTYTKLFSLNIAGASTNADSLPSATANRNGTDDGSFTLTVSNLSTGLYKVTGTIPSGYVKGDVLNLYVSVLVGGVAGKQIIDTFMIDSKRIGDLADLSLTTAVPTTGNSAHTLGDCLNAGRAAGFGKWVLAGTALTLYASDGTTVVRTFALDSATTPTQRV